MKKYLSLSNNQLKLIAIFSMLSDHIGKELLPQFEILQIFGRLALPIFAYMIAEGCRYTKNRQKYLARISILAIICQSVYFIAEGSLYQNILVTFSLSVITIFVLDNFVQRKDICSGIFAFIEIVAVVFICVFLPDIIKSSGFRIDYGIFGVLLPVVVYFSKNKVSKLISCFILLIALSFDLGGIQWFSLISVLFLALYNEKRGKLNLKYLFYIFYPLHLVIIYLIDMII